MGRGLGRGHGPLPRNVFDFESEMATFSAFWALAHVARGASRPPLDPPVELGAKCRNPYIGVNFEVR